MAQATLPIEGMTCAACAARIERKLGRLDGVDSASVNYATEQAAVAYDPALVGPDDLVRAVEAAGYGVREAEDADARRLGRRLAVSVALSAPLAQWLGWSPSWSPPPEHAHDWLNEALTLAEKLSL